MSNEKPSLHELLVIFEAEEVLERGAGEENGGLVDEDVQDIRALIERLAKRHGEENPLPTGYVLAASYLDDDGHRTWTLRYDPDQGYDGTLGLAKLVALDTERIARDTLGIQ